MTTNGSISGDYISTHALREEGDVSNGFSGRWVDISTHALREEGDPHPGAAAPLAHNFYPRPPRGGRPRKSRACVSRLEFLPTPSARRATGCSRLLLPRPTDFYPRPPRGGRLDAPATPLTAR